MVWKFFQKIGDSLNSLAHTVGDALGGGYKEVTSIVSGAGKTIQTQLNNVHDEVNSIVSGAKDLGTSIIDKGSDLIKNTENKFTGMISTPLLLVAGGLAAFMVMNGKGITDTAQVAVTRI